MVRSGPDSPVTEGSSPSASSDGPIGYRVTPVLVLRGRALASTTPRERVSHDARSSFFSCRAPARPAEGERAAGGNVQAVMKTQTFLTMLVFAAFAQGVVQAQTAPSPRPPLLRTPAHFHCGFNANGHSSQRRKLRA